MLTAIPIIVVSVFYIMQTKASDDLCNTGRKSWEAARADVRTQVCLKADKLQTLQNAVCCVILFSTYSLI